MVLFFACSFIDSVGATPLARPVAIPTIIADSTRATRRVRPYFFVIGGRLVPIWKFYKRRLTAFLRFISSFHRYPQTSIAPV
jgi:hypothetical protein